jgi:hypothetical protein
LRFPRHADLRRFLGLKLPAYVRWGRLSESIPHAVGQYSAHGAELETSLAISLMVVAAIIPCVRFKTKK